MHFANLVLAHAQAMHIRLLSLQLAAIGCIVNAPVNVIHPVTHKLKPTPVKCRNLKINYNLRWVASLNLNLNRSRNAAEANANDSMH